MNLTTGQPFWLAEHGLVRYPELQENITCDVAVVGGDITGAFLGYYLTRAGLKPAVLEARYAGSGSTSASTAMCQYELDEDLTDLRQKVGTQRANDAYRGNVYAVHALGHLSQPGEARALPTGTAQIWETARPYLYTRTTPDGRIMVGGRDEVVKQPTFQNLLLEHKARKLTEQFQELFAHDTPFTRDFVWGGVYGETADGLP